MVVYKDDHMEPKALTEVRSVTKPKRIMANDLVAAEFTLKLGLAKPTSIRGIPISSISSVLSCGE